MAQNTSKAVYDSVPLPLGKTMSIRVINIRPQIEQGSEPIVCDFSILDVDSGTLVIDRNARQQYDIGTSSANKSLKAQERIQFHALSYTWGSSQAPRAIVVNDVPFSVGKNLFEFLELARACNVRSYLWIDAICIDQAAIGERNHQVGMMGEVYSRAERVIVWLGCHGAADENDLKKALEVAEIWDVSRALKVANGGAQQDEIMKRWLPVAWRFGELAYWGRAWIVQEFYLAKQKEIWYGRLRIHPKRIKYMVDWYNHCRMELEPFYNPAAEFLTRRGNYVSKGKFATFTNLCSLLQHSKCADRRDRVFALSSLLSSEERRELDVAPDYSKSATVIFLQLISTISDRIGRSNRRRSQAVFRLLDIMLRPDLQDRDVQLAILNLRTRRMIRPIDSDYAAKDHDCGNNDGLTIINSTGCCSCHVKPSASVGIPPRGLDGQEGFSREDWKIYVQTLLASEDVKNRDLGIKYCRDRFLNVRVKENGVKGHLKESKRKKVYALSERPPSKRIRSLES